MTQKILEERAEEMAEFILPMIQSSDKTHDIKELNGQTVHYLNTDVGLLLLLNRPYTEKDYNKILETVRRENIDRSFNVVFYKDLKEEMYFRKKLFKPKTDADITRMQEEGNDQSEMYKLFVDNKKKEYYKESLKHYGRKEKEKMIDPTKPEAERIKSGHRVTYYQPKSPGLERALVTYTFWDVVYKYPATDSKASISDGRKFVREEEVAKDCFWQVECKEHKGFLIPSFNIIKSTTEYKEDYRKPVYAFGYLTNNNRI